MKAIIPVAGADIYLNSAHYIPSRPLIPVGDNPILGHIIENLISAGIKDHVFVVNAFKEHIRTFIEEHYASNIHATFIEQAPRRGLAHALWVCRDEIRNEKEVLVTLGDTIFLKDTHTMITNPGSVLGVHEVDQPQNFGIVITDDSGKVISVKEKPQIPISNLALVGLYKFDNISILLKILDSMIQQPPTDGNTYSLTEAIMAMIQQGVDFNTHTVEEWYDCGSKAGILQANRILLQRMNSDAQSYQGNIIIPPVYISPGSQISGCIIGPHVSLGQDSKLRDTIIRNSVISSYSSISSIQLENTIVGHATILNGRFIQLQTGDHGEIEFEQ